MSLDNALARLLLKCGWHRDAVQVVMTAFKYDAPNPIDASLLARKIWHFIWKKQREAVLSALAADAIERWKTEEAMKVFHCDPVGDDPDQLTLDLMVAIPWPIIDKTGLPDVDCSRQ